MPFTLSSQQYCVSAFRSAAEKEMAWNASFFIKN